MKRSDLKKQIEEVITEILSEVDIDKTAGAVVMKKNTNPSDIKKLTAQGIDVELKEAEDDEFDAPEKEPSKSELKKIDKEFSSSKFVRQLINRADVKKLFKDGGKDLKALVSDIIK
jgi:hypothetical protein